MGPGSCSLGHLAHQFPKLADPDRARKYRILYRTLGPFQEEDFEPEKTNISVLEVFP